MSSPCIDDDPETRETFQNDTSSRRDSPPPCENVPDMVLNLSVTLPWEINALRRTLALGDAPCFEQHFDLFAHAFAIRTTKLCKILHLHIPKTGGTSLCSLAKENSLSTPGSFCWRDGFCPLWCGCSNLSPTTCQQIHQMQQEFIMNENYIISNPEIMMGKQNIAGTRITVELILEKLSAGESVEQIIQENLHLNVEAIKAALAFAAQALKADIIYPSEKRI